MLVAPTEYVFLTDVDLHAVANFYEDLLSLVKWARADTKNTANYASPILARFDRKYDSLDRPSKPHPATMLLSKSTYWLVGGCDEDFVGSYGFTDPHFWHRTAQTSLVTVIPCHEAWPAIPALLEHGKLPRDDLDRNVSRNSALFKTKVETGEWSQVYLRFSWRRLKTT